MRPNKVLARFALAFAIAVVDALAAAAASAAALTLTVNGPEHVVFDQRSSTCGTWDIPDAPARAFRNADGDMVLFAPNFQNRASVGPDLEHLSRDCAVRFAASGSADPALLDDRTWLHAFWTDDGKNVFALASASFIPYRHKLTCDAGSAHTDCWLNGLAALQSSDGGETFQYLGRPPRQLAFPPPEPYSSDVAEPPGFLTATNIVSWKGALYTIVYRRGSGSIDDPSRNCLARAEDDDPLRWELWDGADFRIAAEFNHGTWQVATTDCARIGPPSLTAIRGLVLNAASGIFAAVFQYRTTRGPDAGQGFYYATSTDLVSWSEPRALYKTALRSDAEDSNAVWAAYPSLIDETSADRNFGTVGPSADLLFVRFFPDASGKTVKRALVAVPVSIE